MFKTSLIALALTCITISAQAQHGVSSGGDYIREVFQQGRVEAVNKIRNLKSCSFNTGVAGSVKDWIMNHQYDLSVDVQMSSHAWIVDAQATCAYTSHAAQAPIFLSYPTCNQTTPTVDKSVYVLIHESAHHLGVDDEMQADAIAQAIVSANLMNICPDTVSVFDPNICSGPQATTAEVGKLFMSGATKALVGNYGIYLRSRLCSAVSGCGAWQKNDLVIGDHYDTPYLATFPVMTEYSQLTGKTQLELSTNSLAPFYTADFCKTIDRRFTCITRFDSVSGKLFAEVETNVYSNDFFYRNLITGAPKAIASAGAFYWMVSGKITANCSWLNSVNTSDMGNGVKQENELLIYGTH